MRIFENSLLVRVFENSLLARIFGNSLLVRVFENKLLVRIFENRLLVRVFENRLVVRIFENTSLVRIFENIMQRKGRWACFGLLCPAYAGHKLHLLWAVLFAVQKDSIFGCGKSTRRGSADFCTSRFYFQRT
jgi:hypothetical protein